MESGPRLKATTLRAYIKVLERAGMLEQVVARLPADTAALVARPPLPATWIDLRHSRDLTVAIDAVGGIAAVRRISRDSLKEMMPLLAPMVSGALRLIGTSPATVLKRLNDLLKSNIQGVAYQFASTGDRVGTMDVHYAWREEVPDCMFVGGTVATLELVLELCGQKKGMVRPLARTGPASYRYEMRW